LQRSLRTDDMKEEWDPLDLALWDEVKRIRGRPDIEGPEGIEDDCIGRNAATLLVSLTSRTSSVRSNSR